MGCTKPSETRQGICSFSGLRQLFAQDLTGTQVGAQGGTQIPASPQRDVDGHLGKGTNRHLASRMTQLGVKEGHRWVPNPRGHRWAPREGHQVLGATRGAPG